MVVKKINTNTYSVSTPGYYVKVDSLKKAKLIEKKAILIWKTKHDIIKLTKK